MKEDGWDGFEIEQGKELKPQWSFTGSLFYSIIVITTIGMFECKFMSVSLWLVTYSNIYSREIDVPATLLEKSEIFITRFLLLSVASKILRIMKNLSNYIKKNI